MKILFIFLLIILELKAVEYKMVFEHKIYLDAHNQAILKLFEEDTKSLAKNPAKIVIDYIINRQEKEFIFSEKLINDNKYYFSSDIQNFPIFYFKNIKFNTMKKPIVNLIDGVNVFDVDNNENNEIFVYGTSHYGGSGSFGKVVILEKKEDEILLKAPIIEATDNYEIKYFRDKNIIIVAQYIWRGGIEAHYGDTHRYKFYIYEIDNNFEKIPIFLSKKKFSDENEKIIEENMDDILSKYSQYKKGKVSKTEQDRVISFVKEYWSRVRDKDFNFIEKTFDKEAFYYRKNFSKREILKDKKRALKKVKKIDFKFNDFLVYKKDSKVVVEYIKSFDINNGENYGVVKSLLELKDKDNHFLISTEKDIAILSLRKDND